MEAYTYSVRHIPSNRFYYGVRKSPIVDIMVSYFTSSKLVQRLIREDGIEAFDWKVRRIFSSYEEAHFHESMFLKRINAVANPQCLNQAVSSPRICSKDSVSESIRRDNISQSMRALWETEDYRKNHPFVNLDTETSSMRGRKGALVRAERYKSGELHYKPKKPKVYKDVEISRGDQTKIVKSNQVPAYRKCGWERV